MENILSATIIISVLGLVFGCLLGVASKIFKVEKDEKYSLIMNVLPGANCGGCGFAGCSQFADSVINKKAKCSGCSVGGETTAKAVAKIMGEEPDSFEKKVAYVRCAGCSTNARYKYEYNGIHDCLAESKLLNGPKACQYGCLGMGTCADVCKFGAITVEDGLAKVDFEKCTGCGACAKACPKGLITVISEKERYIVKCMNKEKGAKIRNECDAGCIGCKLCEKNCPKEAVSVDSFLAKIDPEKCIGCGICIQKCPRKIIQETLIKTNQ